MKTISAIARSSDLQPKLSASSPARESLWLEYVGHVIDKRAVLHLTLQVLLECRSQRWIHARLIGIQHSPALVEDITIVNQAISRF